MLALATADQITKPDLSEAWLESARQSLNRTESLFGSEKSECHKHRGRERSVHKPESSCPSCPWQRPVKGTLR